MPFIESQPTRTGPLNSRPSQVPKRVEPRSPAEVDAREKLPSKPAISPAKACPCALTHLSEIGEHTVTLVHEMRSPLTVILNGLKLCHQMPLPQIMRQRLTLALEEAERINRMVDEVIVFAHHARYPDFRWSDLELNTLLGDVLQLLHQMPLAQQCQIAFEPSERPVWVRGDRDKLKQVLINLLVNACEAVDETGHIRCQVELAADQTSGFLRIWNGYPPHSHTLKPSGRRRRQSRHSKNLGLGLLLVKRLVDAHEGKFRLESASLSTVAIVQLPVSVPHV